MPGNHVRVLLVEDDEDDYFLTTDLLSEVRSTAYEVTWISDPVRAIDAMVMGDHDLCLLDFRLGALTGLEVLSEASARGSEMPAILLTGDSNDETDRQAMDAGAADYLVKGTFDATTLDRSIRYTLGQARAVRSLRESERRFRAVVEAATDGIVLTDDNGRWLMWNQAALELFGIDQIEPRPEAGDSRLDVLSYLKLASDGMEVPLVSMTALLDATSGMSRATGANGGTFLRGERLDGTTFPVEVSLASWRSTEGGLWSAILRDVTEREALERELVHQAFHDPLTGLANRALFHDRVEHTLSRLARRPARVSVLFIDLDDFKQVNDTLGHGCGDELLIAVAHRVRRSVREQDTVARLGGDEFAVLLEDVAGLSSTLMVADRILAALEQPISLGEREVTVRSSIGIAVATDHDVTVDEIMRNADVAMYAAKGAGKGRYSIYEDSMHAALLQRVKLEGELRLAVLRDEIEVLYQPILDLVDRRIVGFEALARWRHPERGLLSPAVFIPIAEQTGLIVDIGRSVLEKACKQVREWQRTVPGRAGLTISVNLSMRQLDNPDLPGVVEEILQSSGLAPEHLVLEVTESMVANDASLAAERLTKLAQLGVSLAMDDFGTGYSALSYLHDLPLDELKVDRSFVNRLDEPRGVALVEAIVTMARSLDLMIVAEGVENAEQAGLLEQVGCTHGQGYLFARPLDIEQAAELLLRL